LGGEGCLEPWEDQIGVGKIKLDYTLTGKVPSGVINLAYDKKNSCDIVRAVKEFGCHESWQFFYKNKSGFISELREVEKLKTCQSNGDGCDSKQQSVRH